MGYLATFQQLVAKLPARAHSPLRAKDSYRLQLTWALNLVSSIMTCLGSPLFGFNKLLNFIFQPIIRVYQRTGRTKSHGCTTDHVDTFNVLKSPVPLVMGVVRSSLLRSPKCNLLYGCALPQT